MPFMRTSADEVPTCTYSTRSSRISRSCAFHLRRRPSAYDMVTIIDRRRIRASKTYKNQATDELCIPSVVASSCDDDATTSEGALFQDVHLLA